MDGTLLLVSGLIGLGTLAWGGWLAWTGERNRRKTPDRRAMVRLESPGRRMSDLVTAPAPDASLSSPGPHPL